MDKKKYGLFLPKKNALGSATEFVKKPSVFDEDSNSDEESNVDWVKKSLQKEPYGGGSLTRQAKSDIQKVLAEDPTAYQYDEVYDELQKNINDGLAAKKSDRKPKYIQSLMKTAELRKRENERRLARQIQKERETEGDEFADKEVFVTSAYKKKLEEMAKMDEEDKHMAMLEDIGDVTKQKDMVGFYRHLYRATVTKEDLQEPVSPVRTTSKEEPKDAAKTKSKESETSSTTKPKDSKVVSKIKSEVSAESSKPAQSRQYKKRKLSESSNEETEPSKVTNKTSKIDNPDADSDSSSDDEKDDSDSHKNPTHENSQSNSNDIASEDKKDVIQDEKKSEDADNNKEDIVEPKPKINIWLKRTVGEVLDAALERYYQRKAERLAARGS